MLLLYHRLDLVGFVGRAAHRLHRHVLHGLAERCIGVFDIMAELCFIIALIHVTGLVVRADLSVDVFVLIYENFRTIRLAMVDWLLVGV